MLIINYYYALFGVEGLESCRYLIKFYDKFHLSDGVESHPYDLGLKGFIPLKHIPKAIYLKNVD